MSVRSTINIADLFCGMGGLTIGAIEAIQELNRTPNIKYACDIDQGAASFYIKNFSNHLKKFHSGDISELISDNFSATPNNSEKKIISENKNIDFLFAGPPCQGHSNLNNHSRRNDPRNFLYLRTIKFIQLTQPKYFLIENVPSVIHSQESIITKSMLLLEKFGYSTREVVIDFMRLGIPQSRKRHVIFGSLNGDLDRVIDGIYTEQRNNLSDVLGDLTTFTGTSLFDTPSKMTKENLLRAEYLFETDSYDLPNELRPPCHQGKHSYKSMYGRLKWDNVAQTITSGFGSMGQGRYVHPLMKRVITPHEAARIQGLPDWLDYSGVTLRSNLQKMIGNAVPPALSKRFILSTLGR
ncbi:DNA cytosine methyltransferase [Pseudomonas sp. B21-048]|uniref:DNA cytosine methyltransferase n=1 Tax=Pseudomonas sp. B21-048 TaxID=2895490 RepID=UPI002160B793|nr:DNA cytosine methyltransferase [Pseudomonas sp. B21-048]UVL00520.1 DNA cytosine methyltransferase [Pseudomonas sp. B21-048]